MPQSHQNATFRPSQVSKFKEVFSTLDTMVTYATIGMYCLTAFWEKLRLSGELPSWTLFSLSRAIGRIP